ncbi:hypothetical protein ACEPPN_006519 [Leptodophora sp. 'Broadleaf-Isolate-01']
MQSIKCKVKACFQTFDTTSLLKGHQAKDHNQFTCPYAECIVSCGRKSDMNRHCKNQHQFGKYVCSGCGYVQRRDILMNHLKICTFQREMCPSVENSLGRPGDEELGRLDLSSFDLESGGRFEMEDVYTQEYESVIFSDEVATLGAFYIGVAESHI